MTKKDYELIAFCVRNGDHKQGIAYILAIELANNDPRFNRNKFLEACGVKI